MEEVLTSLPLDLHETYRRMIEDIPEELKSDAIRLLQFLVHCKRPLKLAEAKEVIATRSEKEWQGFEIKRRLFCDTDILIYCPSLVTVIDGTDELHLAHFSVKEYLLGEDPFGITAASISITKTCLRYLTDIDGDGEATKLQFPLARLAAELWTDHAVLAQASEDIVEVSVRFLENEATFQRWTRLYQADVTWYKTGSTGSRLYHACFGGLTEPARVLIGKGADVNAQSGHFGNALQAAALVGHHEVVKLLLDKGADVNAQGGDYFNALQAASFGHHQEVVQLLRE